MPVIAFRKSIVRKRRRRLIPRKRLFKVKSLIPRRTIYIHKGRFKLFKHRTQRQRLFRRFNVWLLPQRKQPFNKKSFSQPHTQTYSKSFPKSKARTMTSFELDNIKQKWRGTWNNKKQTWAMETEIYPKKRGGPAYDPSFDPKFKEGFEREKTKSFKKPYRILKGDWDIQKPGFKKGHADFSKVRTYTNYGAKGRLGPHPVIVISPTIELMKAVKKQQGTYRTGWMSTAIKNSIDILRDELLKYAKMIINEYVPKDTGDLRASLMKELERRRRTGYRLEMRIGTPVMGRNPMVYANPVNNMSEEMLQHSGVWEKRRGKIQYLDDPKAQHGWYEHIRMKLNNYLHDKLIPAFYQRLIKNAIKKAGIGKIPAGKLPKSFELVFDLVETRKIHYDEDYVKTGPATIERELKMKRVEKPLNLSRMTEEEYAAYLKLRNESRTKRFAKYRQKVEKIQKDNQKLQSPYKYNDVYNWFKVEIPFKR